MKRSVMLFALILPILAAGVVGARYLHGRPARDKDRASRRQATMDRWTMPNAHVLPPDETQDDFPQYREMETSDSLDAIWAFYSHQATIDGAPGQVSIPTARPLNGTYITHGRNGERSVIACRQNRFWSADFGLDTRQEKIAVAVSQSARGAKTHILMRVVIPRGR